MEYCIDAFGWLGALGVLWAYFISSTQNVLENRVLFVRYQILNIVGAAGLLVNSFYYGAVPSVIVNLIWAGIGLFSVLRAWQLKQKIKGHTLTA